MCSNDYDGIREGFFAACAEAEPAKACYVSLYLEAPYYGGPEEGGWWGTDVYLVAYQRCATEQEAQAKLEAIKKYAAEMAVEAMKEYGDYCKNSLEWLEQRNLEPDFLPEPDGPTNYVAMIEDRPGSHESRGPRHYE